MLCCFFLLGIPALIFSLKAREQYRSGRFQDAQENARTSRKLNIIGIVIGSIAIVYYCNTIYRTYVEINNKLIRQ